MIWSFICFFGGLGQARELLGAAAVAAVTLYDDNLPGPFAYIAFVYAYLLAGMKEACWLGAPVYGYNLGG